MARRLLLISTSVVHGTGYLDHCAEEMARLFGGRRVLFVPHALHDRDAYAKKARERLAALGLGCDSLHEAPKPLAAIARAEAIFVGGGNTFRLLRALRELELLEELRRRVLRDGVPYAGTSAGSNLACPTIRTTNDMPIVEPGRFEALALVPFQINPHYLDPDPASTHQGETREKRIEEYLEENDAVVVGLREGAMLSIEGDRMMLAGTAGARLFRRGTAPVESAPGDRLDWVLAGETLPR